MSILRFFDIILSLLALIILLPLLLLVSIFIKFTSNGPILFVQQRVGKNNIDFGLFKFRTMHVDAHKKGSLTVGGRDKRITKLGYYLRKFKIDELPQLVNVLKGEMSLVGPRPELRKYVNYYTSEQKKVLNVLPGITDYASIYFRNENELLGTSDKPEDFYIQHVMPEKIRLNFLFIHNRSLSNYFKIIWLTAQSIVRKHGHTPSLNQKD